MIRHGKFLETPIRRGDGHRYYSSSGSIRHYDCHRYHPYRRSDRKYFPDEFKKAKRPTFEGDLKKPKDVEAWLPQMKKFFELHEYTDNIKAKIATFSLKGKSNIWWEDVKWVRDINMEDLIWHEFKRL